MKHEVNANYEVEHFYLLNPTPQITVHVNSTTSKSAAIAKDNVTKIMQTTVRQHPMKTWFT